MGNINIFDLNEIIEKNKASVFIETGTLNGDGVEHALKYNFKKIISIEIIPEVAEIARKKFADKPNVEIITGHSTDVLKEILPTIDENILFWLDAHFPGCDANHKTYDEIKKMDYSLNLPLEDEINLISDRVGKYKDAMICDDLWIYEDVTENNLTDFDTHCAAHNHNITLEEINPGKDLSFLYNKFGKTHEFKKVYMHQGFVIVYPKI
jgi:hypothetical protein